jgi:winged helix-turn-helix DNA-binding protein
MPVKASVAAAKAIAADPQASNRAIAEKIGVTHTTVNRVRTQLEQNVPVGRRTSLDGKIRKVPGTPMFSHDEFDEEDGIDADMVEGANAAIRRRVFLKCAAVATMSTVVGKPLQIAV